MRRLLGSVVCPVAAQELESLNSPPSPSLNPPNLYSAPSRNHKHTWLWDPFTKSLYRKKQVSKSQCSFVWMPSSHRPGNAHYREMLQTYSCHSTKTSPNMSPNAPFKPMLKKTQHNKNKFTDKGMYKICWTNQSEEKSTACINPQMVWRETRSPLGSGNETMRDPKS